MIACLNKEEPTLKLQRIGAGSFATVYSMTGTRTAYKVVRNLDAGETLEHEYDALITIYICCNSRSLFRLPRPIAFYDPSSNTHRLYATSSPSPHGAGSIRRTTNIFQRKFDSAVYTMERVFVLPADLATQIAYEFYPDNHRHEPGPRICRLYFGKVLERKSKFFNPSNFPLDPARYQQLQLQAAKLAPMEHVAYGMGEMLGRIHWLGGFDARDVEFILGGDGYEGYAYYVIDFNQMREWGKSLLEIANLVDAHYQNDPYYPRARSNNGLYQEFRRGYLSVLQSVGDPEAQTIAEAFLQAIEDEQSRRDEQNGTFSKTSP